jgi:hypothetical protein
MLIGDNTKTQEVHGLSEQEEQSIRSYLQGAVYCWCNTKEQEWFSARDFLGGENFFWEGTPCYVLYRRHIDAGQTPEYAFSEAARSAGLLLKSVLAEDNRTFETETDYARRYRWVS